MIEGMAKVNRREPANGGHVMNVLRGGALIAAMAACVTGVAAGPAKRP